MLGCMAPLGLSAQPQDYVFERLTITEGLPENSALDIVQDRQGFLWFGTKNGLVKYDGYALTIYQPAPDDPQSLSDRQVYAVY